MSRRRWSVNLLWVLVGILGSGALLDALVFSGPTWSGPSTAHFDGERFFNAGGVEPVGPLAVLDWILDRDPGSWEEVTDAHDGAPPPHAVKLGAVRLTFINHATFLVQLPGINVLTDPIWSERCSPIGWVGPRRHRPPGIRFEDLPPIDVVLISHNHYDHLDLPTVRALAKAHDPLFVVGLGNAPLLRNAGARRVVQLDWWDEHALGDDVTVHGVPAQHFSGRAFSDRMGTLWMGVVLTGPAGPLYFAGDTGDGPHFASIRERFGPPRLAMLPIGAFRPRSVMEAMHLSPEEAVSVHQRMGAHRSVGMHFGTFRLADDGQEEPVAALHTAMKSAGVRPDAFWALGFGEGRDVGRAPAATR